MSVSEPQAPKPARSVTHRDGAAQPDGGLGVTSGGPGGVGTHPGPHDAKDRAENKRTKDREGHEADTSASPSPSASQGGQKPAPAPRPSASRSTAAPSGGTPQPQPSPSSPQPEPSPEKPSSSAPPTSPSSSDTSAQQPQAGSAS